MQNNNLSGYTTEQLKTRLKWTSFSIGLWIVVLVIYGLRINTPGGTIDTASLIMLAAAVLLLSVNIARAIKFNKEIKSRKSE